MTNAPSTNTNLKVLLVALFVLGALATATVGVVHAQVAGGASTSLPDVVPPQLAMPLMTQNWKICRPSPVRKAYLFRTL